MLTLSKIQLSKFNEIVFDKFVHKIADSINENLEIEDVDLPALRTVINEAGSKYGISLESTIEDYCLLYYGFPKMQKKPLHSDLKKILQHKTKPEDQKIDELTETLMFNAER